MSHNALKLLAGVALVGIPIFLFKDKIFNFVNSVSSLDNSGIYASDQLGASGGVMNGKNSEIF